MYYFDLVIEVINNNGYFQGIMHCVKTQNNLYSYNMIAHSLEKIHISENKEKITDQRLIYQYSKLILW
jgi:hypothetical protein